MSLRHRYAVGKIQRTELAAGLIDPAVQQPDDTVVGGNPLKGLSLSQHGLLVQSSNSPRDDLHGRIFREDDPVLKHRTLVHAAKGPTGNL